ncbi:hypothetical protein L1987_58741 [Smallanthus sonchifolius]|uniref:Uncharacterized protein n=1 Tax=Smallanthus sonchifolius TaxID=185202 RepID=A0ACB9D3C3_9ASTR|nr:hypothetical protein L1987_58741 [Smallanthus sonchifolius]
MSRCVGPSPDVNPTSSLLNSLVTNAPLQDGFFNTSVGNGSDRVYGLGWCRADVSPETCSKCLNDSIRYPLSSSSSTYGGNGLDDPDVFTRGFSMMETLQTNVSNQPLKFATSVIDVGEMGREVRVESNRVGDAGSELWYVEVVQQRRHDLGFCGSNSCVILDSMNQD